MLGKIMNIFIYVIKKRELNSLFLSLTKIMSLPTTILVYSPFINSLIKLDADGKPCSLEIAVSFFLTLGCKLNV